MRKTVLIFLMTLIFAGLNFAQTIFSNGTGGGNWNAGSTWQGGVVPGAGSDVIIAGSDSVYTDVEVTCNNLTLLSGCKFATGVDEITVTNTTEVEADAYFYNRASSPTLPGAAVNLDPASYVVHSGSGTVGGPTNFEFGNLVIRRNAGVTASADLIINGDLIVDMLFNNLVFRGANLTLGESRNHTVFGNVYIYKGALSCIDVGDNSMVGIWNINGNAYVFDTGDTLYNEARIGCFSSPNAAGTGIINIAGDLIIDGGRLQAGTSSTPGLGTGIINIGGDLIMSPTSGIATNSIGPFAINFNGTGAVQTVNLNRNFLMSTLVNDTIKTGANVVFDLGTFIWTLGTGGSFVVDGSLELRGNTLLDGGASFSLNPNGTLKIGSPDGIAVSDPLGNVQMTGGRTYNADANYEYKGTGAQSLGDGLPDPVAGFAVNNPNGIILDRNLTVNSSLDIINGDLILNGNTVTLGSGAALTESSGNTVTGISGRITTTRNIGTPSALNVGGLGAVLTAGADLGSTTIERFHSPATGIGNQGILRRYNISPGQNNSGLNATLRLYYDDSELNGLNEAGFQLFKSANGSDDSWGIIGGTVNTIENYVEVSGISDFSHWTIADLGQSLPVDEEKNIIPVEFALHQNYPNPFNPETNIRFELPSESFVNISVFNIIGEEVATLVNEKLLSGVYSVSFTGENLPSGLYLYRLTADNKIFTKKIMLLK